MTDAQEPTFSAPDPSDIDFYVALHTVEPTVVLKSWDTTLDRETASADDWPITYGVGSSTLIDSDGDIFEKSAVEGLRRSTRPGMTMFRNHKYDLPEDVIGQIPEVPEVEYDRKKASLPVPDDVPDFAMLKLKTRVCMLFDHAAKSYWAVQKGMQFGHSGAIKYNDARPIFKGPRGVPSGFRVKDAESKEWSWVTLPSNPIALIGAVRKSMVAKGVLPPDRKWNDPEVLYRFTNRFDFNPKDAVALDRLKSKLDTQGDRVRQYRRYFEDRDAERLAVLEDELANFGIYLGYDPADRRYR